MKSMGAISFSRAVTLSLAILLFCGFRTAASVGASVSPTTMSFGSVNVNSSSPSRVVTLANTGGQKVVVQGVVSSNAQFSVAGPVLPLTLSPGQTAAFQITFTPVSAGSFTAAISFSLNRWSQKLASLVVAGVGVAATAAPATGISASPTALNFGNVPVGGIDSLSVTVTNSGIADLSISQVNTTGSSFSLGGLTLPLTLTAGQSTGLTVFFSPGATGAKTGTLSITNSASNSPTAIQLNGAGVQPQIVLPSALVFGSVQVGATQTQNVAIKNTGGASLSVMQATISGAGFSLNSALPMAIAPGSTAVLTAVFTPGSQSSFSGTISVVSNAPGSPSSVPVSGAGVTATTSGPVSITPSLPPSIGQGEAFQFSASDAGTWSCSGTDAQGAAAQCKGSIDPATGVYTAPANITAQQALGGYQLLPNNHIFNTRIDSFPLRSDSSTLIAASGTSTLKYYEISKPINYTDTSTPTQNMLFYYTPANDGPFQIPAYPNGRIEGGWISAITNQPPDHHLLTIDTSSGILQDQYQYYTAGLNPQCPSCTSQSGVRYGAGSYSLPSNGAADAAGLYMTPLVLRLQDIEQALATGGTINHALRFTLPLGYCASSNVWPATTFATDGGTIPFGTRFRLKSSFNISSYSPTAQVLLTQLKQYGLILADGGTGWSVDVEYTKWPAAIANALFELSYANIGPSNFEVVDESGYMLSPTSGETTSNREIVTFTRAADGATASVDVVLTGVTVSFPKDLLQVQVGAPAQQLTALVNGTNNPAVNWSMNPAVGTLSSTGLYSPPASVSAPTTVVVTATSVVNPLATASMTLNVFPAGPIRLIPGSLPGVYNFTMVSTSYLDLTGNLWSSIGDDGGYSNDFGAISGTSEPTLYRYEYLGYTEGGNDMRFDFVVPNGSYQLTYKGASTIGGLGSQVQDLELNGTIVYPNLDLYAVSGGSKTAWDFVTTATVANNQLSFVLRTVNNGGTNLGALQITPLN